MTTDRFGLSSRQVWTLLGVLLGIIAAIAIVAAVSNAAHWDLPSAALFAVAGYLFGGALLRPWWFWNRGKAVALRDAIGDRGALVTYLLIGVVFGGLGAYRAVGLHDARRACQQSLSHVSATDPHAHISALLERRAVPLQAPVRCSELLGGAAE